jgi:ribosomal protein L40E
MQAMDPLNDHLPHLDMMIQAIQNERYDSIYEQYAELDQIYGMLYGTYIQELQYLAADDPHNSVAEKIGEQFLELRPYIQALHDDLSLREYSEAVENLEELKEHTLQLFSLFAEYKRVAASGPKYSDIPYTQELIRVCRHYLSGDLAMEAVQGRLDIFCQFHELLETQISTLIPSPPERKTFEERMPDLDDALDIQMHAIEDLDLALERGDNELIEETLEHLTEAAEVLVEVYQALQKADLEPRKICCIRCGADNSIDSRLCGACGAVLPQSAGIGTVSTIALEEDGSNVASVESEELTRMRGLVDEAQVKNDPGELLDAISDYRTRWERNQRHFESLDEPPADLPPAQLELLSQARQTFADAMKSLQESMQLLEDGATVLDLGLMEVGLTRMQEGESLFGEFAKEFERAQEMAE